MNHILSYLRIYLRGISVALQEQGNLRKIWAGDNGVGDHYLELPLAVHTEYTLMGFGPTSAAGLHMDDLILFAMNAGNSHRDIRALHLRLAHNGPPFELQNASSFCAGRMLAQALCQSSLGTTD